jgi:putative DNA methylase
LSAERYRARAKNGELAELHYCTVLKNPNGTRKYRNSSPKDREAYLAAKEELAKGLSVAAADIIPVDKLSGAEPRRLNVVQYGFDNWGSLFNSRQKLFLLVMAQVLSEVFREIDKKADDQTLKEALNTVLALSISNLIQYNCNMATWLSDGMISVFIQSSSIPMRADYAEANPLIEGLVGGLQLQFERTKQVLARNRVANHRTGAAYIGSASKQLLPDHSADLLATDPPYYFAIPYAELADFFYVWLRRFLSNVHPKFVRR